MADQNTDTLKTEALAAMAAPYNPRKMPEHEMASLRSSMRTFGTVQPIVVNRTTQRIVGGHQRVRAAELEGITELPVIYVELSESGERQLNLALNRISGVWDNNALAILLQELSDAGANLDLTGFPSDEVDLLLARIGASTPPTFSLDSPGRTVCPKCGHEFTR